MKNEQKWSGSPQVSRTHYFSAGYISRARFEGLQAQLELCMQTEKLDTILEIGPGPGLLTTLLRHLKYKVHTIDLADDLYPDVVGRLPELPFRDCSFDGVCAFQVLEHIPFSLLGDCLLELKRLAKKKVLISLPSQQDIPLSQFCFDLTIGKRKYHKVIWRKNLKTLTNPEEHFWELEHNGIDFQTVIEVGKQMGLTNTLSKFVPPWFQIFSFDV